MKRKTAYFFVLLAVLWTAGAWCQSLEPVDWSREHIFTQMPRVVDFQEGTALLRFSTVRPVAATVHYGGFPADQDLALPLFRFRSSAKELPDGGGYEVQLRVSRFARDTYNMAKGSSLENVVVYRVEILDTEENRVRYFESRFRFEAYETAEGRVWAQRPCIVEGPFVDLVTANSAVISLTADYASYARVRLGDRLIASLGEDGEPRKERHHEIRIDGLDPAARYDYQAEIASREDFQMNLLAWPQRSFQTAPLEGARTPFTFAYMSDSRQCPGGGELGFGGVNYGIARLFMVDLYRRGADLVLFGGDLVDGYTSSEESYLRQLRTWKKAIEPVGSFIPIYEGMGNHEQVGDYLKVSRPERKDLTIFANRAGEESGEALFAGQFVNPEGSVYGFGPPLPEDQWPGVGGEMSAETARYGLPHRAGPPYDETVYSFNYDNVHFVSVNSNYWHTGVYYGSRDEVSAAIELVGGNREGYVMEKQLDWLKRDLDAAQEDENIDWIMLFTHEPPFPVGGHLRDAMFWGQSGRGQEGGMNEPGVPSGDVIDMRNRFWGLISSYDKTLVLFDGDEHNYSRTYIDDSIYPGYRYPVWQITSGGAGAPFYGQDTSAPWTDHVRKFTSVPHYCLVTVQGKEVQLEVWTRAGRLVEQVVLSDLPR
jgi:hypothetical protein